MSLIEEAYKKSPYWIQAMLFNAYAVKMHLHRYGSPLRTARCELTSAELEPAQAIVEYQNERLRAVVKTAYDRTRYYRKVMDARGLKPEDIREVGDLTKLPLLEKETVRNSGADLLVMGTSRRHWLHGHTSGTTGSPLSLWYDRKTCVMTNAADQRQKRSAGLEDGEWLGIFLGRMVVDPQRARPPFWQQDFLHHTVWFSTFHLSDKVLDSYLDEIKRRRIRFLEGYPSTLFVLARHLLDRGGLYFVGNTA